MNAENKEFLFIPINDSEAHIEALYWLLKGRTQKISHQSLPSFEEHKAFVLNHPYREWFLIEENKKFIGSIYILENNCVGVNISGSNEIAIRKSLQWILANHKPLPKIKSLRNENFHINVHPENETMSHVLSEMNSSLIEYTYIIKE